MSKIHSSQSGTTPAPLNAKRLSLTATFGFLLLAALAFFLMWHIQFNPQNPYFSEFDSYYHVKMAEILRDHGIIKTFPWMQFTTLKDSFVDQHLLFHILLIPFITLFGTIFGAKLAIVVIVSSAFGVLYLLYRKLQLPAPLVCGIISLFFLAGDFYFRMNFIRNMGLSLVLLLLGILATFHKKPLWLGIISFLYVWAYGAFFLLPGFVFIFFLAELLMHEKEKNIDLEEKDAKGKKPHSTLLVTCHLLLATGIGSLAGLVINPYFPNNISYLWLQIFQTGLGAKDYTGGEWRPYDTWYWVQINAIPLIVFAGSVVIAQMHHVKQSVKSVTLLILNFIFLVLVWKSKRFIEYSPLFIYISAFALVAPWLREKREEWQNGTFMKKIPNLVYAIAAVILIPISFAYASQQIKQARNDTQTVFSMSALTQAQDYLKANSQAGDIVFTDDWDVFPRYFFTNDKDYYIVGLDPEFMNQYAGEPYPKQPGKLYKEFADISSGRDNTILEKIKADFRAKWIIVNGDHVEFYQNLKNRTDLFEEVLTAKNDSDKDHYNNAENDTYHIFKVL